MDPMAIAGGFASIVGLVGQYKAGRDSVSGKSFDDFMQWLVTSNHSDLKALIEANHGTVISIKAILNQDREALHKRLEQLDSALVAFASAVEGFAQLGKSLYPEASLSDQAISILVQIEENKASKLLLVDYLSEDSELLFLDGCGGQVEIADSRFLEGDLQALVDARLLLPGRNSQGNPMWTFTRAAAEFVKARTI
ncbi:hypothetical protein [Pseudomonas nitroreducens]|uniref:hypothetical protein n=1 Tax=Pseudomonas nitroreducens TaxID=46680 RepID=UPI001876D00F|nr:hypothetical protein [Pseudomonas nitritireducens]